MWARGVLLGPMSFAQAEQGEGGYVSLGSCSLYVLYTLIMNER